jgi:hypothetical protein
MTKILQRVPKCGNSSFKQSSGKLLPGNSYDLASPLLNGRSDTTHKTRFKARREVIP